jgi:hypothetical protein
MIYRIGEGRTTLRYEIARYGGDFTLHIDGGASHIGSVSVGEKGEAFTSAFPGHQEQRLTEPAAKALSAALSARVVVTAGVHLDDITAAEIETILDQNKTALQAIAALLQKKGGKFDEDRLSE